MDLPLNSTTDATLAVKEYIEEGSDENTSLYL